MEYECFCRIPNKKPSELIKALGVSHQGASTYSLSAVTYTLSGEIAKGFLLVKVILSLHPIAIFKDNESNAV